MSWGTGGLGYLRNTADADTAPFDIRVFSRLMRYVGAYRRQLGQALAVAVAGAAMTAVGPYLIKVCIDSGITPRDPRVVLWSAGLFLLTRVAAAFFTSRQIVEVNLLGNGAVFEMRRQLFAKFQALGFRFFDREPVGVLVSRQTNDITSLSNLVSSGVVSIVTDAVTLVGIVGMMLFVSPKLALASFVTLPGLAVVTAIFQGRAIRAFRAVRTTIARLTAEVEENLSGIRVTQAFARERVNVRQFAGTNGANLQANMDAATVTNLFGPAVQLVSALGTIVVLWFGGTLVLHATVTVGVLVAFLNYLSRFFQPIQDLTQQYNLVQQAMAAAEKMFSILDEAPDVEDRSGAGAMPRIAGHVRFRHVTFAYRPGLPVLRDLDFELPAGCRAALVGPTGAGKTTVTALLLRFYDAQEGAVEVDGVDLRGVTQASYRRQVAAVLQDPVIFSTTIAENIRYGRLEAGDAEVRAAAAAVGADDFIQRLGGGYDTQVGERGARLSQGQKQLVSFARALLADPRILILDEATANIDSKSEHVIQTALGRLLEGRTSLVIAHRLSTVRDADVILVLDEGVLVGRGTHAELLAAGGLYASLYRRQFGAAVDLPA